MKILVVDDHALFAEGIRLVLEKVEDVEVNIYSDFHLAVKFLKYDQADIMLVDLYMPNTNGFEVLKVMRLLAPNIRCVVISSCDNPRHVQQALDLGAVGFIAKSSTTEEMVQAIRRIYQGGHYVPADMAPYLRTYDHPVQPALLKKSPIDKLFQLTARQQDVLKLVSLGKPNKEISRLLNCSEATVKAHLTAILRTLGASNRTEAARFAELGGGTRQRA